MVQILMAEDTPLRLLLVDMLTEIDAKPATVALAQRAVFDLSPDVRRLATAALRDRPRADARPVLVNALRYPWPAAADHAAEALVALEDREAAPLLVALLDKPDPAAPTASGKGGASVREVVRVNHRANCLLCHAPSAGGEGSVLGPDPSVNIPRGGGGGWSSGPSVFQPLLVREATLFALRALTGRDAGPSADAWRQLFPHADAEAEGARLSAALLKAPPEQREPLLARYRDAKDDRYTEGLAHAIPHLGGQLQAKAREALVARLARLPADLLRARLQEEDDELRRAAALACVRRADRESVPDLIGLLLDADPEVAEGARKVLRKLSGEDFGPRAGAGPEERVTAASDWQAWWHRQATP
jgi:HEAT repeat protein